MSRLRSAEVQVVLLNADHDRTTCPSVPLNVDLDTTLTVVAGNLCRILARKLPRYETATPDNNWRHFLDATGTLHLSEHTVTCALNLRSHHPALIEQASPTWRSPSPGGTTEPCSSASPHAEPGRADLNQISAPRIEADPLPSMASRRCGVALRGATGPTGGAQRPAWQFGAKWSGLLLGEWSARVGRRAHTVGSRRT